MRHKRFLSERQFYYKLEVILSDCPLSSSIAHSTKSCLKRSYALNWSEFASNMSCPFPHTCGYNANATLLLIDMRYKKQWFEIQYIVQLYNSFHSHPVPFKLVEESYKQYSLRTYTMKSMKIVRCKDNVIELLVCITSNKSSLREFV